MHKNNSFSQIVTVFHERVLPEKGRTVGYAALFGAFSLKVPLPDRLCIISEKHKRYKTPDWEVFTPRHSPTDDLIGHLTFAIKYEGLDLHLLSALFKKCEKNEIETAVKREPFGIYHRKIWFLYEWLLNEKLDIPDIKTGNFIDLVDSNLQYPGLSQNIRRHRIRNNLPGVRDFCPLIRKTEKLEKLIHLNLSSKIQQKYSRLSKDLLTRTAAFLLLQDSKASFSIEDETPTANRAQRWAKAIGQAGHRPLSKEELLRLQQIIIQDIRFVKLGWRTEGGFIGEHDRSTGTPIPSHISSRWKDIDKLIAGLLATQQQLQNAVIDPVLVATMIAFGFVFIHPFTDGNGRIHRYLIHHILTAMGYTQKGIIFPVSSAMLDRIDAYRKILEEFSNPRLDLIEWKETPEHNVEVLNETMDLYRYFDATKQAEFLYECIHLTVEKIIPEEVDYLLKHDKLKLHISGMFEMPNQQMELLIRFLEQGAGKLSGRARKKEFRALKLQEIIKLEKAYIKIFKSKIPILP